MMQLKLFFMSVLSVLQVMHMALRPHALRLPPETNRTTVSGVGWSGSGFMIAYHIGVLDALVSHGVVELGVTPMAGSSGGAHVAVGAALGASQYMFIGPVKLSAVGGLTNRGLHHDS